MARNNWYLSIYSKTLRVIFIGLLSLLASACGGGGSSGGNNDDNSGGTSDLPTIALLGEETAYVEINVAQYEELGASASDYSGASLTVAITGEVNTQAIGSYTVTYTATDDSGLTISTTRTVIVRDTTPPTINVNAEEDLIVPYGSNYDHEIITASDNYDAIVTVDIEHNIDTTQIGEYTITYIAIDSEGNEQTLTRIVKVRDTEKPTITLEGPIELILEYGEQSYSETDYSAESNNSITGETTSIGNLDLETISTSASVTDNDDIGSFTSNIDTLDLQKIGTYTIEYTAIDSSDLEQKAYRTVIVQDTTAPTITLSGNAEITLEYGETYEEPGTTVFDHNIDYTEASYDIPLDINQIGTHTITYTAIDNAVPPNSSQIERTVIVEDNQAPQVTLNSYDGSQNLQLGYGLQYIDPGITIEDADDDIEYKVTFKNSDDITIYETGFTQVNSDVVYEGPEPNLDTTEFQAEDSFTVSYIVKDGSDNTTSIERQVSIIDSLSFITTWKPGNAGKTNSNQIEVYVEGTNILIDWGDGTSDTVSEGNHIHTYSAPVQEEYDISMSGGLTRFYFPFTGGFFAAVENTCLYRSDLEALDNLDEVLEQMRLEDQYQHLLTIDDITHEFYDDVMKQATVDMLPSPNSGEATDAKKLVAIKQWGDIQWTSMKQAFATTSDIQVLAEDAPDLRQVTDMSYIFGNSELTDADLSSWDTSNVEDLSFAFHFAYLFEGDISTWDVSNVKSLREAFSFAESFDSDISGWSTTSLTDLRAIFKFSSIFNQDLSNWDVSNVTSMCESFRDTPSFNADLSLWDVSKVTDMKYMFSSFSESVFTGANLNIWGEKLLNVEDMTEMFSGSTSFNSDISSWNTSNVTSMNNMFYSASSFNQNLGRWNVSKVTDMSGMFDNTALDRNNYDSILQGWSNLSTLQSEVKLSANNTTYSVSAQDARDLLEGEHDWVISDAGLESSIE